MLESSDWGFYCTALAKQKKKVLIDIFHGVQDEDVPLSAGQYLAAAIPHAKTFFVERENHSMVRRKWEDLLEAAKEGFFD